MVPPTRANMDSLLKNSLLVHPTRNKDHIYQMVLLQFNKQTKLEKIRKQMQSDKIIEKKKKEKNAPPELWKSTLFPTTPSRSKLEGPFQFHSTATAFHLYTQQKSVCSHNSLTSLWKQASTQWLNSSVIYS